MKAYSVPWLPLECTPRKYILIFSFLSHPPLPSLLSSSLSTSSSCAQLKHQAWVAAVTSAPVDKRTKECTKVTERPKRAYKKTILKAAWPCYIQCLRKEERKMRALADTLKTNNGTNDSTETLANYLSNVPEEFQQLLGRILWKHQLPWHRGGASYLLKWRKHKISPTKL